MTRQILFLSLLSLCNNTAYGLLPVLTVHCGDEITQSARIGNDLNCPENTTNALSIVGDNITIEGQGHTITAPKSQNGIFVHGKSIKISGIQATGILHGNGIFVYDSPELTLEKNIFSRNQIGIEVYTDQSDMTNIQVNHNEAIENSVYGIRIGYDSPGDIRQPHVTGNDLDHSGSYALDVKASYYEITTQELNEMKFSKGGIYLHAGDFYLHDFSLIHEEIEKAQIFIESAHSVTVKNIDLSTNYQHEQTDEAIGLDLYRAESFDIDGLTAMNNDVGLKLETEKLIESGGHVKNCHFSGNYTSGIMMSSYDQTIYGSLTFQDNIFDEPALSKHIYVVEGTQAFPQIITTTK